MSESCCSVPDQPTGALDCLKSASPGKSVKWLTVAALAAGRIPPKQEFWLCRDPGCEVVYFGSSGSILTIRDLTVVPGFKNGSDGLVCYCFQHRTSDIARDLSETGSTGILEAIKKDVKARQCACEVKNPSGKCCLGEVQRAIRDMAKEMEVAV